MGKNSVRGEGTRRRVPDAGEGGGSDSPHDGGPDGAPGGAVRAPARPAPDGPVPRPRRPGSTSRRGSASRHGRRGKRRVLRWVAAVLSLLILGTAGAGYLYYRHLNGILKKDDLNLGDKPMAGHKANAAGQTPLNILLIGSDARNSDANKRLGGAKRTFDGPPLADVQMLLHVSADRSNMSVISMPRDTMLNMPKCTDPETGESYPATARPRLTNESLGRGGPGCTVATWYKLTDITIDHFMMIDFSGVVSMADAIGGVPVCVTDNVHSRNSKGEGSGLKLEEGTTYIKGEQALQWLRTRYGFEDGTDLARAHGQHMYMNSMVRELKKNTKLSDPNKLRKLAESATRALTVDPGLDTVKKLYDLGEELKKVPTSRITMTTMPSVPAGDRVLPKPDEAELLFKMIREDTPLDGKASKKQKPKESKDPAAPDAEIGVMVQNGTYTDALGAATGRAREVAGVLVEKGFTEAKADIQRSPQERTTVYYPSVDLEGDAQAVAKSLGLPLSSAKKSTEVSGVTLVVGADWRTGSTYPKSAKDDGKAKEDALKSARALKGDNDEACMDVQPGFTW
ncbi:transcriptional regulator [Streptomyces agglomeratus]|uniref:LCP family protein n=1 Tax=Streptomyces agglomeratus TaxID=285458 RepID=UPI00086C07BC|nr:LCP family protein [Streptomyces agglomeratus]OEJ59267.1 transcriptional regulator [Streptomyces agglomeratus]